MSGHATYLTLLLLWALPVLALQVVMAGLFTLWLLRRTRWRR